MREESSWDLSSGAEGGREDLHSVSPRQEVCGFRVFVFLFFAREPQTGGFDALGVGDKQP